VLYLLHMRAAGRHGHHVPHNCCVILRCMMMINMCTVQGSLQAWAQHCQACSRTQHCACAPHRGSVLSLQAATPARWPAMRDAVLCACGNSLSAMGVGRSHAAASQAPPLLALCTTHFHAASNQGCVAQSGMLPECSYFVVVLRRDLAATRPRKRAGAVRDRTQDLLHAKQTRYHCATTPHPTAALPTMLSMLPVALWPVCASSRKYL
jgi:hypothetical protein